MEKYIGTQCYGLRKEFEKDFIGTIDRIAEIGFTAIEPLITLGRTQGKIPLDIWSIEMLELAAEEAADKGMSIPSMHVGAGIGNITIPAKKVADSIAEIHDMTGCSNYVFSGMFSDAAGAKKWGTYLRTVSDLIRPMGCTVIYHNHDDEWAQIKVGGQPVRAIEYFLSVAGPDVMLELDVGWASLGYDEVRLADRYRRRIAMLHCRDFDKKALSGRYTRKNMPVEYFVPVGTGAVKVREIIEMADQFPAFNGALIVEQEKYSGEMLDAMAASFDTISSWIGAAQE